MNIMRQHKFTGVVIILFFELVVTQTDEEIDLQTTKLDDEEFDTVMHDIQTLRIGKQITGRWFSYEQDNAYWHKEADDVLKRKLARELNTAAAKNVILFLGDGMSVPTLTAARTFLGQRDGKPGEEGTLYWETFPYSGLTKTWCLDKQVSDSACTATAYLGGVKAKSGTLGLNGNVERGNCDTQKKENHVNSIAKWAQDHGKAVGIVTTTRVTHATPAGAYAHAADRRWESDTDVSVSGYDPKQCLDIATQLVKMDPGKNFKVIMGGGRRNFLPNTSIDDEGKRGIRSDNINLITEWINDKSQLESGYAYVWNRTSLNYISEHPEKYDYVLGLFESSHCKYHLEAPIDTEPTLTEMTETAIKVLSKEKNGYFLFVEGGRIDHGHHASYANIALDETIELARAVEIAGTMTSAEDTLMIVTADHSHTMSISGYPNRGNPINNLVGTVAMDNIAYPTISYANGPGYRRPFFDGSRYDPSRANFVHPRYRSVALIPLRSETHGGDDVAIFASGPWAHLFTGTFEQSNIPHFIKYASSINKSATLSFSFYNIFFVIFAKQYLTLII